MLSNIFVLKAYADGREGRGGRQSHAELGSVAVLDDDRVSDDRRSVTGPALSSTAEDDDFFAELQDVLADFAERHPDPRNWC